MSKIITYILLGLIFTSHLISKTKFFSVNMNSSELCLIEENGSINVLNKLDFINESRVCLEYYAPLNSILILKSNGELYSYDLNNNNVALLSTLNTQLSEIGSWVGISVNSLDHIFLFNEVSGSPQGRLFKLNNLSTGEVVPFTDFKSGSPSILGIEFDDNNRLWNIEQCCNHRLSVLDGFRGQIKQLFDEAVSINYPQDLAFNEDNQTLYGIDIKNEFTADRTDFFIADRTTGKTEIFLSLDGLYSGIAELTTASNVEIANLSEDRYKVFPNPSSNFISIDCKGNISDIKIYNLKGEIVLNNISTLEKINISDLNTGTYIINFKIDGKSIDRVFIKN